MIKAIYTLILACLLWVASKLVIPVYISSRFVLRAIDKQNSRLHGDNL